MTNEPDNAGNPEENVAPFVVRKETFTDHRGHTLIEHILVSGELPEGYKRFQGQIGIRLRTAQGEVTEPHEFVIEADTQERAFDLFQGAAQAAANAFVENLRQRQQQQQNSLALPPQESPRLMGPDGNYIT